MNVNDSRLRTILLIFIFSALPVIALLIFLNVKKRQVEQGDMEKTAPAEKVVAEPTISPAPSDDG